MGTAAIETEHLTKRYGSTRGIVDVDLRVEQGEVFAFLGPNGAGKTTLIRTLVDLIRPTSGRASILGLDSHRDSVGIRRRTGFVSGDLGLYERLTGREHLDWLGDLAGGVPSGRIASLAERFELDLTRPIKELSRGNRQKVGLVQAFMTDADLYILDEPTSGLDPLMQLEFRRVAREVVAQGRTVFLSSHVLDEVQHVSDRVGIIRDGRLEAVETVQSIRDRSVRHITVRFGGPAPLDGLGRLGGIHDLVERAGEVRFRFEGSMGELLRFLAAHEVVDLLAEPADLDEVFLSLFGSGGDAG